MWSKAACLNQISGTLVGSTLVGSALGVVLDVVTFEASRLVLEQDSGCFGDGFVKEFAGGCVVQSFAGQGDESDLSIQDAGVVADDLIGVDPSQECDHLVGLNSVRGLQVRKAGARVEGLGVAGATLVLVIDGEEVAARIPGGQGGRADGRVGGGLQLGCVEDVARAHSSWTGSLSVPDFW